MKALLVMIAWWSVAGASASPGLSPPPRPSPEVVETCLTAGEGASGVKYVEWPYESVLENNDPSIGRESLSMRYEGQTVGIWTSTPKKTWGITFNGQDMPARRIVRLDKKAEPYRFEPTKAQLGEIRDGKRTYVCVTFNFDGIGRSGSFQDIRGIYLIHKTPYRVYYTAGQIRQHESDRQAE